LPAGLVCDISKTKIPLWPGPGGIFEENAID